MHCPSSLLATDPISMSIYRTGSSIYHSMDIADDIESKFESTSRFGDESFCITPKSAPSRLTVDPPKAPSPKAPSPKAPSPKAPSPKSPIPDSQQSQPPKVL